jgi:DNA polymerase III delta prime subunit
MNKEQIYKQIDSFVNQRVGKSKLYEIKYYVDTPTAKDRAKFTQWIFENNKILKKKKFNNIIDLCYGSGNLTAHILYESDINTQNLILNDINEDARNNDIVIGTKTTNDFLDATQFDKKYDLIVFNPQVGGKDTYQEGAVEFEKSTPILYDGSIDEYLDKQGVDTSELKIDIDKDKRSIFIHSETLSKSDMNGMFREIKIFNYYDILYQSKESKIEGVKTNIIKFRKTLDKISNDDTVVVFLGEDAIYETLFADYTYASIYLASEGKNLYILSKDKNQKICYEYIEDKFVVNEKCKKANSSIDEDLEIEEYIKKLDALTLNEETSGIVDSERNLTKKEEKTMKEKFITDSIVYKFPHKNLLLKGVPGTGKSQTIENIIEDDLQLNTKELQKNNVCRVNIHSASSNADLMQGIGIDSKGGNIEYKEKQGLIYNHIKKALFAPKQPFVLVLEEIQENSLNELIGDLIYLIEETKRVTVDDSRFEEGEAYEYQKFIEIVLEDEANKHSIEIPYLVDTSTAYRKMVLPSNLYLFCTSNYRDDKKVIEDNLLRRFDVVEIYPQTQESLGADVFKSKDISNFLEFLNSAILKKFETEIHPDRYLIGHANWLEITEEDNEKNKKLFYTALLKVIIEFKEIREVDFDTYTKEILEDVLKNDELSERIKGYIQECHFEYKSYKEIVEKLQKEIYSFVK